MTCHVRLYTTARAVGDLPGTHLVDAQVGATTQGELVRMVEVPLLMFIAQWKRYTAGGHLATETTAWHARIPHATVA